MTDTDGADTAETEARMRTALNKHDDGTLGEPDTIDATGDVCSFKWTAPDGETIGFSVVHGVEMHPEQTGRLVERAIEAMNEHSPMEETDE